MGQIEGDWSYLGNRRVSTTVYADYSSRSRNTALSSFSSQRRYAQNEAEFIIIMMTFAGKEKGVFVERFPKK